jgi:hypothetical protein
MLVIPVKTSWLINVLSRKVNEAYVEIKPYWTERFGKVFPFDEMGVPTGVETEKVIFSNGFNQNSTSIVAEVDLTYGTNEETNKLVYVLRIWDFEIY